ncbi:MAG: adenosylhomocysteinase [Thermaerobacter sp.]|nr:adenosylhomocysteinase [Bacillota bacterium]
MIRDPSLAPSGWRKLRWVEARMPVLAYLRPRIRREGWLRGRRVAICLHLEAKTAHLARILQEAGAEVAICGSNPLSTQDDVAAALAETGVRVYAWHGADTAQYREFIRRTVEFGPELVIDDGGDLVNVLHNERADLADGVLGGSEETTTGVQRLRAMAAEGALRFPMIAANDSRAKYLFDNRYGTGQSVWDGIMRSTNLVVAGKTVVVIGYGWCGKGVALRARGLGARVVVCEVDPVAANEALLDGCEVMPSLKAAEVGDIFITVTGCRDALAAPHFERMKDGALLANAGHFDVEINKHDLRRLAQEVEQVRPHVEAYRLAGGRTLYLLAEGRLVNLAAGDGHPAEIMDMSFGVQVLALRYLVEHARKLPRDVIRLPGEVDEAVCRMRLEALGIAIDTLTPEQQAYLSSWQEGT